MKRVGFAQLATKIIQEKIRHCQSFRLGVLRTATLYRIWYNYWGALETGVLRRIHREIWTDPHRFQYENRVEAIKLRQY